MAKLILEKVINVKSKVYCNGELATDFPQKSVQMEIEAGEYNFGFNPETSQNSEKYNIESDDIYHVKVTTNWAICIPAIILIIIVATIVVFAGADAMDTSYRSMKYLVLLVAGGLIYGLTSLCKKLVIEKTN